METIKHGLELRGVNMAPLVRYTGPSVPIQELRTAGFDHPDHPDQRIQQRQTTVTIGALAAFS